MGAFCCLSTSANCCCLPSAAEAVLLGIPFLVASLGSWGGVLGTLCLPSAQGLGNGDGVLKPVGLMPLGEAFARALLVLLGWSSTAGPSSQVTARQREGWSRDQAQM